MTVDEIITILTTPIDYEPIKADLNRIKADLDRIGAELDALEADNAHIMNNINNTLAELAPIMD